MSDGNGDAEIPTVPYFLVLLVPGPNIQAAADHFAAHVAFIETMEASNVVLLGGEFEATLFLMQRRNPGCGETLWSSTTSIDSGS